MIQSKNRRVSGQMLARLIDVCMSIHSCSVFLSGRPSRNYRKLPKLNEMVMTSNQIKIKTKRKTIEYQRIKSDLLYNFHTFLTSLAFYLCVRILQQTNRFEVTFESRFSTVFLPPQLKIRLFAKSLIHGFVRFHGNNF